MCRRIHGPRDPYEHKFVSALVSIGYSLRLSSDHEDEVEGFDAEDIEYGIPIDFHVGPTNTARFAKKLAKQALSSVRVFTVPLYLHDAICSPSCNQRELREFADLYESFLETAGAFRRALARA